MAPAGRAGAAGGGLLRILEEREGSARRAADGRGLGGFLGDVRLSHVWRPMARAAIQRRLSWRLGEVVGLVDETPRERSVVLDVPGWPGHLAGQHVDVRLTADDGHQTQRSYAIATPPDHHQRLA